MSRFFLNCVLSFVFSTSIMVGSAAYSQTLPGSVDSGRFDQRFLPADKIKEDGIIGKKKIAPEGPIPTIDTGFILIDIELEGGTALSDLFFQDLITEYKGRTVDLSVLNHLASRITQRYRDDGYFLSKAIVPKQKVIDGIVKIQVIEGYVDTVTIDDPEGLLRNDYFNVLSTTIDAIKSLRPLYGPALERSILLLNDASGIEVQSILSASKNPHSIGAVDVVLKAVEKDSEYSIGYNNLGSRFVGPHQINTAWSGGNLFNSFDSFYAQSSAAIPFSEVIFGALSYTLPLKHGLTTSLIMSYSASKPGHTLKDLEVEGDNMSVDLGISYPVIRSRRENLNIKGNLFIQNSATEILDEELIDDKTRVLSIGADYSKHDNWNGLSSASLTLNKGLHVFGATKTGDANLSRAQGRSDFFSAEIKMERLQDLNDFVKGYQALVTIKGQYTPHSLLSSQEIGFGGSVIGRAYDPSELTGDKGFSAVVEARYMDLPVIDELKLVPFAFYDLGKVWNNDTDSEAISAASAGGGTHYVVNENLSGSIQVAWPLTKKVLTPIMNGKNGPRILFSTSIKF